jgi:hypothetical protein
MRIGCVTSRVVFMTAKEVDARLSVPGQFEAQRPELVEAVVAALAVVLDFSLRHGWSHLTTDPFFYAVEIHATQESLWRRILDLNDVPFRPPPTDALTAALECHILMAVVPEEAEKARPEYFRNRQDWICALAHEISHRLHVRILGGNEHAMGPEWFYEGFAILASGQRLGSDIEVRSIDEAFELAGSSGRGSYARYAASVRFLAERIALPELVSQAGRADFEAWLKAALRDS